MGFDPEWRWTEGLPKEPGYYWFAWGEDSVSLGCAKEWPGMKGLFCYQVGSEIELEDDEGMHHMPLTETEPEHPRGP